MPECESCDGKDAHSCGGTRSAKWCAAASFSTPEHFGSAGSHGRFKCTCACCVAQVHPARCFDRPLLAQDQLMKMPIVAHLAEAFLHLDFCVLSSCNCCRGR